MKIKKFAKTYIDAGWKIVPLAPKSKRVTKAGWIGLEFTEADFREGDNIGLRSVDGFVFCDLDSPEAVNMADLFLPETTAVYGRPSKPRSKRIYRSDIPKTIAYKDFDKTTLVELRSNHQDMAPPSVHPSGEVLAWEYTIGEPPHIDAPRLIRAVKLLATAAIIGRHYAPPGARHDWCLALAGMLKMRGVTEEEMVNVITASAHWSKDPKEPDRISEVSSTYGHSDDDPLTGATRLKELSTEGLVEGLTKLWGRAPTSSDDAYALNSKGYPDARSVSNITLALDKLGVQLSYDTFSRKPFVSYNGTSGLLEDDTGIDLWLDVDQKELFRSSKDLFFDVIKSRARQSPFHPVLYYFNSLNWDGEERIDTWLTQSAEAANTPYIRAVSCLVLIAAVRRIKQPGCKFDEMLVLETPEQGKNKSTGIQTLCHDPSWFSDDMPLNCDSKNVIERTSGKFLIEASDLAGLRVSDVEALKSMLSRQVDGPVRLAYARLPTEQPRQFIIIGTTNSTEYLMDHTGNRRFWPVSVREFDVTWLRTNRDQLWAEACVREATGEPIRLDPSLWEAASVQQTKRVYSHPWVEALAEEYSAREPGVRLTREELWNFLTVPLDRRTSAGGRFISTAMKSIGYRRMTVRDEEGKSVKGWGRD